LSLRIQGVYLCYVTEGAVCVVTSNSVIMYLNIVQHYLFVYQS